MSLRSRKMSNKEFETVDYRPLPSELIDVEYPVLTIRPLWALAILLGLKRFETRSWKKADLYGGLLIHASGKITPLEKHLAFEEPFASAFREAGYNDEDLVIELTSMQGKICGLVFFKGYYATEAIRGQISERERRMGNWGDNRFAWEMDKPEFWAPGSRIRMSGKLGVWKYKPQRRPGCLDSAN